MDYTKVRRKDREVHEQEFYKEMLNGSTLCSIGLSDKSGNPYVNSNLFIYNDHDDEFFFHTAGQGHTKRIIEENNNVCVSITKMGRLYTAPRAYDFGVEYFSVVIFGLAEIVTDDRAKVNFFNSFLKKYFPDVKPDEFEPPTVDEARRATVYKVKILHWTAKKHELEKDHVGAREFNNLK